MTEQIPEPGDIDEDTVPQRRRTLKTRPSTRTSQPIRPDPVISVGHLSTILRVRRCGSLPMPLLITAWVLSAGQSYDQRSGAAARYRPW